jgi:hypothetical protein
MGDFELGGKLIGSVWGGGLHGDDLHRSEYIRHMTRKQYMIVLAPRSPWLKFCVYMCELC